MRRRWPGLCEMRERNDVKRASSSGPASQDLSPLEKRLGYAFRNLNLLQQALTHTSYVADHPGEANHNERFEFLGDAALKLTVTEMLLERFPMEGEGFLTKVRAFLISDKHLSELAAKLGLRNLIRLGRSITLNHGRMASAGLVANTLEAILGAVYQDGGHRVSDALIRRLISPSLDALEDGTLQGFKDAHGVLFLDYKTALQERMMKLYKRHPRYLDVAQEGDPTKPSFTVATLLLDVELAQGKGNSKKEAGQQAAREALERLASGEPELLNAIEKAVGEANAAATGTAPAAPGSGNAAPGSGNARQNPAPALEAEKSAPASSEAALSAELAATEARIAALFRRVGINPDAGTDAES